MSMSSIDFHYTKGKKTNRKIKVIFIYKKNHPYVSLMYFITNPFLTDPSVVTIRQYPVGFRGLQHGTASPCLLFY